ncbi:DgyrCDS1512 [Dimorphilus gyrociliatus]|uniref:DgyrCDS1512 n=1 Tax=Dimorphilus gyrociliatus TaxID=2664684 RepID=A0A7I8V9N6_9ANNE|nr:DgyrCDS1512 [Dimorphilus gyrociliatus]
MMNRIYFLYVLISYSIYLSDQYRLKNPENEYQYSKNRDSLIAEEEKLSSVDEINLNDDEKIVDNYLHFLKVNEFLKTSDSSVGFPPSRPIEEKLEDIKRSDVYKELINLPKGGNMHTHESFHIVGQRIMLEEMFNSEDFEHLYVIEESTISSARLHNVDFFINPPPESSGDKWVQVKDNPNYTIDKLISKHLLINILTDHAKKYPTDSAMRWRLMNTLWGKIQGALRHRDIRRKMLWNLFDSSLKEGVQFVETRANHGERIYVLDKTGASASTFGRKYLDTEDEFVGQTYLQLTREVVAEFSAQNPNFIGYKIIMASSRRVTNEGLEENLNIARAMFERANDLVRGVDMVAHEDAGRSHMFFLENLVNTSRNPTSYFHGGETNYADDLIISRFDSDPVNALQNTYEIVLLGAKRVGHGVGFAKHPYLLNELKKRDVAIEICPVSNQILGYTADLRNHPGVGYIRNGLPVILGSDDPGNFGYDSFTVDWYEVFMGWGLDLRDLKKLASNSIKYSVLTEEEKQVAVQKWEASWNNYTATTRLKACKLQFKIDPTFNRVLPREGALNGGGKVHIYGRHFEKGICQTIKCKFGNYEETEGELLNTYLINCQVPSKSNNDVEEVPISISLNGTSFIDTDLSFTFKYHN